MASLTIRNLTATSLELTLVERFEAEPVPGPGGLAGISSAITGFFNATTSAARSAATPTGSGSATPRVGAGPTATQAVSGVVLGPFSSRTTDYRAADPGREVVRLTFAEPGAAAAAHRYTADVPGPSTRSQVLAGPTDGGGGGPEFTAVYVASGATLAIFSSARLQDWMATLADGHPLSQLSIPGTHNSPTCHTALPSVRCQAVGVRAQLDNGVRFLDVRVNCSGGVGGYDDLALVHSAFPISLTGGKYLADLLVDVYGFLDDNPREVVLMSLKREGTGRGTDADLSRHLHARYTAGDAASRWFTEPRIPTLGEARGLIVLIRRFGLHESLRAEHAGAGWGVDASVWPDNCADGTVGSGLIRVQDFYEVDQATNIQKKIELTRAQLERAASQRATAAAANQPPSPLFINFLSASNFFNASCWPEKIAAKVNPAVVEYLCVRHGESGKGPSGLAIGDAATGIVVTDWVGLNGDWDLLRCIVGWNARLQLGQ